MSECDDLKAQLNEDAPVMTRVDFFFNKERRSLYREMALMLIGAMLLTFIPFFIGKWIDKYNSTDWTVFEFDYGTITLLVAVVLLIVVAWYLLVTAGRSRYIRNIAMNKLRTTLLRKIDRLDVNEVEKRSAGRYVEYISNEQQNISRLFNNDAVYIVEGLFIFGVVTVLMILTDLLLALIYILLLPITYFVIRRVIKSMKTDAENRQKAFVKMNSYLDDVSHNYSLVKMYGLEGPAMDKFERIHGKLSKYYRHVMYTSGYVGPMERILENSGFIIAGIAGVLLLNSSMITAGMFLTFISYTSLIGKPLSNFADGIGRLRENKISVKRVSKFLMSDEDERHGDIDAKTSDGNISFRDVTYISGNGKKVLDSVSFDITSGEHIAMVGVTGSGKRSIIDLMVALQATASGNVMYGGKDVFEYEKNSLRRSISVIPTVPWIMDGTVMENILVASPGLSEDDAKRASESIGFDRIVERMENGYGTHIGDDIGNMSLAEKQILSLVRLVLSDPKVVIFDDSFSAMDALTAAELKDRISGFLEGRTVITRSDDISDMISVDRILFINNGCVRAGSHDELSQIPEYARIVDDTV